MAYYRDYRDGADVCEAYVAEPEAGGRRPAALIAHQWSGQSDHERRTAEKLAALGYVGIAIDVYGKGIRGTPGVTDPAAIMKPWREDRAALLQRLMAAVSFAKGLESVDPDRIAIMGYCFGGMCALDVARSGTSDVKGAVSLHGVYTPPEIGPQGKIAASVLVLHGWDDPMNKPDAVEALAAELTDAGADWQIHAYGHAMHAFTMPHANAPHEGKQYNADADRRSWQTTVNFLAEVFA